MSITEKFSKSNNNWNLTIGTDESVGGHFCLPNSSCGYHGILKQFWDYYHKGNKVLLISEGSKVKNAFKTHYPSWDFTTLDFFPGIQPGDIDIVADLCTHKFSDTSYSLIICQATLEHVINPFQAMSNMIDGLEQNGILVVHTHPPGFPYHAYPRDYLRFMKDFWYDFEKFNGKCELLELVQVKNDHVFSCYKKK